MPFRPSEGDLGRLRAARNVGGALVEPALQLGVAYNFGLAKLSTSVGTFNNDALTSRVDLRNWWAELNGKITSSSTWMATYGKIDDRSGANRDANLMALCLMYHLSRRTDLHAAWARMSNNTNSQYLIIDSTNTGLQTVANVPLGYDPTAIGLGIRRRF